MELVTEKMIGDPPHVHEVLCFGSDPAEDAVDGLDQHRRLHQSAIDEVREVVEMPDVVALELELGAAFLAEMLE